MSLWYSSLDFKDSVVLLRKYLFIDGDGSGLSHSGLSSVTAYCRWKWNCTHYPSRNPQLSVQKQGICWGDFFSEIKAWFIYFLYHLLFEFIYYLLSNNYYYYYLWPIIIIFHIFIYNNVLLYQTYISLTAHFNQCDFFKLNNILRYIVLCWSIVLLQMH